MAGDTDKQSRRDGHPVAEISRFTPCQLQALKSRWLTTIEALVAAAATDEGRTGLCEALGVEPEAIDELLLEAKGVLGEARYRGLSTPAPGGPTGALWDENSKPGDPTGGPDGSDEGRRGR